MRLLPMQMGDVKETFADIDRLSQDWVGAYDDYRCGAASLRGLVQGVLWTIGLLKVLHLGKFDGDVGGIERQLRALLRAMPST